MTDLVAIGECMVELSRQPSGGMALGYGGDTFNTAVYAARLGLDTGYGTALGDDPYSQAIFDLAAAERVGMAGVPRLPGRVPGLYAIETDAKGERRFYYWRDSAPARSLFELPDTAALVERIEGAACVYFSGITLSLYSEPGLGRFREILQAARARGARIAFDGNFRPRGWAGDTARARRVFGGFLGLVDIVLPTFDDEQALWGDASPQATLARLASHGIGEIVVKDGINGAVLQAQGTAGIVPVPVAVTPVDTTAAGDSFNAGYLAGRLRERPAAEAALLGHRLAARVIGHRGAIIPPEAMADL
ncbi:sugar kinase [Labrys monachus]|uniref:2-dehydro-3-deoxygluconokinase n=1 Tax=Labrys monachus TaxID=217067 RepID=A0ABU0F8K0_9HYPH|nr:sugar kinase [Labrys monachus]MDQ0390766.1 2-dehydro-3-deoxygluconokinase [Labrys monachus]